jgi:hypothetical protein
MQLKYLQRTFQRTFYRPSKLIGLPVEYTHSKFDMIVEEECFASCRLARRD